MFFILCLCPSSYDFKSIIDLKLIYNGCGYQLFPTLTCKQFKMERYLMGKLKFKHLDEVFGMF